VILHLNSKADEKDRGRPIVDIFRIEDGKLVEHWDVTQDVPEKAANGTRCSREDINIQNVKRRET